MSKPIAIIGASGNMGSRYRVIMDYLNIPYESFEEHNYLEINSRGSEFHSVLICSPTNAHFKNIMSLKYCNLPMLCEKPLSKHKSEINKVLALGLDIDVVNQYKYYADNGKGESYYSFYNSGQDGLPFDCISIIALSNNPPVLDKTSPIWKCSINGKELDREKIDRGYVRMIEDWYKSPKGNPTYIEMAHNRVFNGFYVE